MGRRGAATEDKTTMFPAEAAVAARRTARALSWVGYQVDDVVGRHVGTVTAALVDRREGQLQWLLVRLRGRHQHVVVPADGVVAGARHVLAPYPAAQLRSCPAVPEDGELTPRADREARRHFGLPPLELCASWERDAVTTPARANDRAVPPRDRLRVLVADDHAGFCALLGAHLTPEAGFTVTAVCHDGPSVLRAATSTAPDVAVLDLVLPGMSGLEVLDLLVGEHGLPCVVTSGHAEMAPLVEQHLGAGGAFVPKEDGPDRIVEAVRAAAAYRAVLA